MGHCSCAAPVFSPCKTWCLQMTAWAQDLPMTCSQVCHMACKRSAAVQAVPLLVMSAQSSAATSAVCRQFHHCVPHLHQSSCHTSAPPPPSSGTALQQNTTLSCFLARDFDLTLALRRQAWQQGALHQHLQAATCLHTRGAAAEGCAGTGAQQAVPWQHSAAGYCAEGYCLQGE